MEVIAKHRSKLEFNLTSAERAASDMEEAVSAKKAELKAELENIVTIKAELEAATVWDKLVRVP